MDTNRVVALGTPFLAVVGIVSAEAAILGVYLLAQQLEQQSQLARQRGANGPTSPPASKCHSGDETDLKP